MALHRTLGCRLGYCTYTAHAVVGRSGQARRAARCSNCCGAFPRGFSFFFPLFFFKSGARSPSGMIPRDVSLCDPAHAAGAYLSIVDPTMRVSSSYPSHRRVIVARLRRHRRRPPIYHPHTGHRRENVHTNQISTAEVVTTKHKCMMEEHVYCE